jgi:DNA-binding FrmR family transcriptional regulator
MKIECVKSYFLSNALHLQFVVAVLNLIGKFGHNFSKIATQVEALQKSADREDLCYKVVRKSNISAVKKDSNKARDSIIIGIKDAVKSLLRHFDIKVKEAANRIKIVIDAYDSPQLLTKLPYDAKTAAVNSLLQEFDLNYAGDVRITGLTPWIEELRTRNKAFESLTNDYNEQQSEKPSFRHKDTRKDTDKAYKDIVSVIKVLMIIDGETQYAPFVSELNTLIKHFNDTIAQHKGRLRELKTKSE